jgi:HEAT repeat protein
VADFTLPPARDFAAALSRLADEGLEPEPGLLDQLSDPSRAEVATWQAIWPSLSVARRRWLMNEMADLTETDFAVHFNPLFETALADTDAEVRRGALDGLWESEDLRLLERFLALLADDPDAGVRGRAASALAPLVQRAEMEELAAADTRRLERALVDAAGDESEDPDVRRRATEAVGFLDTPGIRVLLETQAESGDRLLQSGALMGMGRNGHRRWESFILDGLESPDPLLLFSAAHAAGDLGLESFVTYLVPLTDSDDVDLQIVAIWALGEIGGPQARSALDALSESAEDDEVQQAVDDALAMMALNAEDEPFELLGYDPSSAGLRELGDDGAWLDDDLDDDLDLDELAARRGRALPDGFEPAFDGDEADDDEATGTEDWGDGRPDAW